MRKDPVGSLIQFSGRPPSMCGQRGSLVFLVPRCIDIEVVLCGPDEKVGVDAEERARSRPPDARRDRDDRTKLLGTDE